MKHGIGFSPMGPICDLENKRSDKLADRMRKPHCVYLTLGKIDGMSTSRDTGNTANNKVLGKRLQEASLSEQLKLMGSVHAQFMWQ